MTALSIDEPFSLEQFEQLVAKTIEDHPIVGFNRYTQWFSKGNVPLDSLASFTVQFSVFSHLFLEAQLRKCINARIAIATVPAKKFSSTSWE